jgi:hypothetical protein
MRGIMAPLLNRPRILPFEAIETREQCDQVYYSTSIVAEIWDTCKRSRHIKAIGGFGFRDFRMSLSICQRQKLGGTLYVHIYLGISVEIVRKTTDMLGGANRFTRNGSKLNR